MTPSLGYPDGANEFNSGIFTWSKATISHNTVTVDAHQQANNPAGRLLLFADGPFARTLVADAPGTYPQTSTYRRTLVMVDAPKAADGKDCGYLVDFFDVAGGREHDYSLHGPTGKFAALDGTWTSPEPGTLAGPDVAVGALYDDPVRGAKDFNGSYLNYAGSGFQHLTHVQRLTAGAETFAAEYVHDKDPNARIRLRVLPQAGQELIMADARVSPSKFPELVRFLIARRVASPTGPELASTFAAVLEPFAAAPFIAAVHRSDSAAGSAVTVTRTGGERDVVIHHPGSEPGPFSWNDIAPLATDAEVAVVTFDGGNRPTRAFFAGGTFLQIGDRRLTAAPLEGKVTAIDLAANRVRVRLAAGTGVPAPAGIGRPRPASFESAARNGGDDRFRPARRRSNLDHLKGRPPGRTGARQHGGRNPADDQKRIAHCRHLPGRHGLQPRERAPGHGRRRHGGQPSPLPRRRREKDLARR